jgi:hypothetical protein
MDEAVIELLSRYLDREAGGAPAQRSEPRRGVDCAAGAASLASSARRA